jgi:cytochrome oxidase Cu insertion factor (SCO1/SenC/PrrC family)
MPPEDAMNNKLLILIAVVIAIGAYYAQKASHTITASQEQQKQAEVQSSGTAAIGGEFSLIDQNGNTFTHENLKGHYSLVFFGFANCPDMCPTALTSITQAMELLPEDTANRITPVFITIDPKRDTPEALKAYAANFHPRLTALSGTREQTMQAATAFKVYHQVADPSVEDYMVNHSGFIYVMDEQGNYVRHFSHTTAPDAMAEDLRSTVN